MSRILPRLYVGNALDAANFQWLRRVGVTHIVNAAAADVPSYFPGRFVYLNLPLADSPMQPIGWAINRSTPFIQRALSRPRNVVFVHCQMGVSRSVALVLAYLMETRRWSLRRALRFVQARRFIAGPNPGFMAQLSARSRFPWSLMA